MAIHSSILAWRLSWTEEPGGLQSMESRRVGHDWSNLALTCAAVVQSASHVQLFATPWTAAHQASLPSPSPRVCPSSCSLHQWCRPAFSSSYTFFSSAFNLSQHQGLFQWVICLHQMTKILELQLQHQSFQWIFRVDLPYDWLVWSPCCPRGFQESSPTPWFKGINSLAFCLLYSPAFTTVRDHWEDHSLDCVGLCQQINVSAFQHTV